MEPVQTEAVDHPNGPRTLWMQLRDNVGMTAESVEQGIRLEQGRHPTLSELRAELGLDLDLSASFTAARDHATPPGTEPSDEQMQALLDAMYDLPSMKGVGRCIVDADTIRGKRAPLLLTAEGTPITSEQKRSA